MPDQARDDCLMKVFTELVGTDGVGGDRCWLDALKENKGKSRCSLTNHGLTCFWLNESNVIGV